MHSSAGPERRRVRCEQPTLIEQSALAAGGSAKSPSCLAVGSIEQISGANEQIPERDQTYLNNIELKVIWEKQRTSTLLSPPQSEEAEFKSALPTKALAGQVPLRPGPLASVSVMSSDDRLSLILRRLDEIERKLDGMLDELRTPRPSAIRRAGAIVQQMIEANPTLG